ncbi:MULTISPECIES: hypothetical protein [unclassified Streptomyces]|uniref:hypothetical protein n=1 Tax=unclassified Streptomyces TaxID=2593676 RepID=UPI0033248441
MAEIGTKNSADAFLGSYSAKGRIDSINKKEGTVTLRFTASNQSDWNSATHLIPQSWNPLFGSNFGATVHESFSWEEKWPLNRCVN